MRAVDRIRKYIKAKLESGEFRAGTHLPCYYDFMQMFDVSYLTIATSLKKLADEGLLEIRNGTGTFIAGGTALPVLINIKSSTLPHGQMLQLLKKYTGDSDLNLEFVIDEVDNVSDPVVRSRKERLFKSAVSVLPDKDSICEMRPASLSQFPDYKKTLKSLTAQRENACQTALPFVYVTKQLGVNSRLLPQIGMTLQELTSDFSWWASANHKAKQAGISLSTIDYNQQLGSLFSMFLGVLLTQAPYSPALYHSAKPLFASPLAQKFFEIAETVETACAGDPRLFEMGGSLFHFNLGSWMTTQNMSGKYPEKRIPDLTFVAFRDASGRKICEKNGSCIKAYFREDADTNEQIRVWKLMQIMTGRAFQLEFCSLTGMISSRNDIAPADYEWNRDGHWNVLFPEKNDFVYSCNKLFPPEQVFQLNVLMENYCFYGASRQETAMRMDYKKQSFSSQSCLPL